MGTNKLLHRLQEYKPSRAERCVRNGSVHNDDVNPSWNRRFWPILADIRTEEAEAEEEEEEDKVEEIKEEAAVEKVVGEEEEEVEEKEEGE